MAQEAEPQQWRILQAINVPEGYRRALKLEIYERNPPRTEDQMLSLRDYSREHFQDPRRANRTSPGPSSPNAAHTSPPSLSPLSP